MSLTRDDIKKKIKEQRQYLDEIHQRDISQNRKNFLFKSAFERLEYWKDRFSPRWTVDDVIALSEGDILKRNGKKYLVISKDLEMGGHIMVFGVIRLYEDWRPNVRLVKTVYDYELDKYSKEN